MTLDPGDVMLTGTPAGVGVPKGTFLKVGDLVDAEIDGIGRSVGHHLPKTALKFNSRQITRQQEHWNNMTTRRKFMPPAP